MNEEYVTSHEAARRLSVHVKTINRWCRTGKLPDARLHLGSRKFGWRISARSVDALQEYEYHLGAAGLRDQLRVHLREASAHGKS